MKLKALKELREQKGYSPFETSILLNMNFTHYLELEELKCEPTDFEIGIICDFFGTNFEELTTAVRYE